MSDVNSFNAEIRKFATSHAPEALATMQRKICLEGLKRLVEKTPVDTGRARANWQVGIGSAPEGVPYPADEPYTATSPDGAESMAVQEGSAQIGAIKKPVACYITNNVEYIEELEHGHSQQAPNGMLAVTITELEGMFA